MSIFVLFFQKIYELFQLELTLYGFTFSFWDLFMFTVISSLIVRFIFVFLPTD